MNNLAVDLTWELPPLILHPFSERVPPSSLLENSKAALMLAGVIPRDGLEEEELKLRLLAGRYSEIRMLYFIGKDIFRWTEQCMDWLTRVEDLADTQLTAQSFAGLLCSGPPESVAGKMTRWGVADYQSIFSRAIGLNATFAEPPEIEVLSTEFLRNYHRYADALYHCYMALQPHDTISGRSFLFEVYASGEYARILESGWEDRN